MSSILWAEENLTLHHAMRWRNHGAEPLVSGCVHLSALDVPPTSTLKALERKCVSDTPQDGFSYFLTQLWPQN